MRHDNLPGVDETTHEYGAGQVRRASGWGESTPANTSPYEFQGQAMRADMRAALDRYASDGEPRGEFLRAVLCNDLCEAVFRADDNNLENLKAIVGYVYNELPSGCHGSRANYDAWLAAKSRGRVLVEEMSIPGF